MSRPTPPCFSPGWRDWPCCGKRSRSAGPPSPGVALLAPFALLGAASVVYWQIGELRGAGDLRPYGFVQFHSALSIALIVPLFASRYTRGADVLAVLGLYALAMLCGELLDKAIFEASRIVSGHTLKHLIAGAAGSSG